MNRRAASASLILSLVVMIASLTDCGLSKQSGAPVVIPVKADPNASVGGSGVAVFQSTFYKFARTNCAGCHGVGTSPTFATANVSSSYTAALSYLVTANPASSPFATYAVNGHCQSHSASNMEDCETASNQSIVVADLNTWASAELASGGPAPTPTATYAYTAPPIAIPSGVPTDGTTISMRWPLSGLTPTNPLVTKGIFEVQIQLLDGGIFRLSSPRIQGLPAPVQVSGIHMLIKKTSDPGYGAEDPISMIWASDVVSEPMSALPTPLPPVTTQFGVTPMDKNAMRIDAILDADQTVPVNSLSVAFDGFATAPTLSPTFSSLNTYIFTPLCVKCHAPGNTSGNTDLSTYAGVIAAMQAGTLITSVTTSSPLMPEGGSALSTSQVSTLQTWITDGAPNN